MCLNGKMQFQRMLNLSWNRRLLFSFIVLPFTFNSSQSIWILIVCVCVYEVRQLKLISLKSLHILFKLLRFLENLVIDKTFSHISTCFPHSSLYQYFKDKVGFRNNFFLISQKGNLITVKRGSPKVRKLVSGKTEDWCKASCFNAKFTKFQCSITLLLYYPSLMTELYLKNK